MCNNVSAAISVIFDRIFDSCQLSINMIFWREALETTNDATDASRPCIILKIYILQRTHEHSTTRHFFQDFYVSREHILTLWITIIPGLFIGFVVGRESVLNTDWSFWILNNSIDCIRDGLCGTCRARRESPGLPRAEFPTKSRALLNSKILVRWSGRRTNEINQIQSI